MENELERMKYFEEFLGSECVKKNLVELIAQNSLSKEKKDEKGDKKKKNLSREFACAKEA